jgi:TPR repeat protein
MFLNGQAVAQNYAEALKWYRLAASQGMTSAQNSLGVMYALGQGTPKNPARAYLWFNVSVLSGNSGGVDNRDRIAKEMSSQQIAEAQQMTRDCQQRSFKGCD